MSEWRPVIIANSGFMVHNFRYEILESLTNHYTNVTVVARPDSYWEMLKSDSAFNNVEFLTLPKTKSNKPYKIVYTYFMTFILMFKIVRHSKNSFFMTYTPEINFYMLIVSMLRNIFWYPNISGRGKYFNNFFGDILYSLITKKSQVCFTQNMKEYLFLSRRYSNVVRLIGSGVKTEFIANAKIKKNLYGYKKFVFVGRLLKEKGILSYLQAARVLLKKYKDLEFTIIGDSEFGGMSIKQLRRDFQCEKIVFLGWQNDVINKLIDYDVLVLASEYGEGLPKVLLEGAAAGCILVSTDCPGARDVVDHGRNGYILENGDSNSIIKIVEKIIEQPEKKIYDLKSNSFNRATNEFNVDIVVSSVLEGIREHEKK